MKKLKDMTLQELGALEALHPLLTGHGGIGNRKDYVPVRVKRSSSTKKTEPVAKKLVNGLEGVHVRIKRKNLKTYS